MKRSEIYRKAASLIEQRRAEYCCCALLLAHGMNPEDPGICGYGSAAMENAVPRNTMQPFRRLFKPDGDSIWGWFGEPSNQSRNVRILALCFAAAIAEDEESAC